VGAAPLRGIASRGRPRKRNCRTHRTGFPKGWLLKNSLLKPLISQSRNTSLYWTKIDLLKIVGLDRPSQTAGASQ